MKDEVKLLELQAEAIKGFAAIAEYLVATDCDEPKIIDAFHTLNDWIFTHE